MTIYEIYNMDIKKEKAKAKGKKIEYKIIISEKYTLSKGYLILLKISMETIYQYIINY